MPPVSDAPTAATLAPRRVPEAYVRGEVATYPLASPAAFRHCLVALDPKLETGTPTFWLWRRCEEEFAQHASGLSIDRMVAIRDFTWFAPPCGRRIDGEAPRPIPMHEYLRHLAAAHLQSSYGVTELRRRDERRANDEGIDAVVHYRWLTLSLPEDLLLAAVPITPPPTRVEVGRTLFEQRLLDEGLAEIHQHGGAGLDFPLMWVGALAALADPELDPGDMHSPGAPFGEGRVLARWLLVGVIVRLVLGEFLIGRRDTRSPGRLPALREMPGRRRCHQWRTLQDAFGALQALEYDPATEPPEFEALRSLYYELLCPTGARLAHEPPDTLADAWRCDPIALRLGLRDRYGDGERWLVRHALRYLEREPHDPDFALAFWQSQRIRCLYYRYLVERPLTAGLQWFIRFYDRIEILRKPLDKLKPEASFRMSGREERVMAALEIRQAGGDDAVALATSLSETVVSWRHVLESSFGVRHRGAEPEFGVIVHFLKERDPNKQWQQGRPKPLGEQTYAQPRGAPSAGRLLAPMTRDAWRLRFGRFLEKEAPRAGAIADVVCAVPLVLWLLRGVDVCRDELGVPTWVVVPLFRYVHQEAAYASVLPGAREAPTLQTTAHVGEDFRHLMEGMRRIYECVQYLLGRTGGRLGHAMALGVEPRTWAESAGSVLMPREDRLWDLVFEWRLYTGFRVSREFLAVAPPGRVERVSNLIADLVDSRWPAGWDGMRPLGPRDLAELHDRLHRFLVPEERPMTRGDLERTLERGYRGLLVPEERSTSWGAIGRVLKSHLEDPGSFYAGQELVDVQIDASEVEGLGAVQAALRRGVAHRGIVVEVNPTSNLLIGDILDLRNHPLLRLFPVESDDSIPPVPIAIGSDDPITFSTSLAGEYSRMHDTACGAGYPILAVDAWLDRIRRTALDARFTRAWRPSALSMADQLRDALDRYLLKPRSAPRLYGSR